METAVAGVAAPSVNPPTDPQEKVGHDFNFQLFDCFGELVEIRLRINIKIDPETVAFLAR